MISAVPEIRYVLDKTRKTSYSINNLRVLHKTRTHSTHVLIFGGKINACPAVPPVDWQVTGLSHWRGKIVYKLQRVFVSLPILLYFFLRSNTMSTPLKVKRNTWSIVEEKDFLLCKEKAITDLLDKCLTSAGVRRPF